MLLINMWVVLSTLQDGASPLAAASQEGHQQIVQLLIEHGAHINSQDKVGAIIDDIRNKIVQEVYKIQPHCQSLAAFYHSLYSAP